MVLLYSLSRIFSSKDKFFLYFLCLLQKKKQKEKNNNQNTGIKIMELRETSSSYMKYTTYTAPPKPYILCPDGWSYEAVEHIQEKKIRISTYHKI